MEQSRVDEQQASSGGGGREGFNDRVRVLVHGRDDESEHRIADNDRAGRGGVTSKELNLLVCERIDAWQRDKWPARA